jgi:hypothetical protein
MEWRMSDLTPGDAVLYETGEEPDRGTVTELYDDEFAFVLFEDGERCVRTKWLTKVEDE